MTPWSQKRNNTHLCWRPQHGMPCFNSPRKGTQEASSFSHCGSLPWLDNCYTASRDCWKEPYLGCTAGAGTLRKTELLSGWEDLAGDHTNPCLGKQNWMPRSRCLIVLCGLCICTEYIPSPRKHLIGSAPGKVKLSTAHLDSLLSPLVTAMESP
jgi:hypothetical protein